MLSSADDPRPGAPRESLESPTHPSSIEFHEVDAFPPPANVPAGSLYSLSLSVSTTTLTHALHRFPAKFVPQVAAWAIDNYTNEGALVADPFSGSGTTLIEAARTGRRSLGIDIDSLAALIARAKTTSLPSTRLRELINEVGRAWKVPTECVPPIDGVENFDHWFTPQAWGELQGLKSAIHQVEGSSDELTVLLTLFSSIVRSVSNADDQSQKTYVSGTRPKSPPDVRKSFAAAAEKAIKSYRALEQEPLAKHRPTIIRGDVTLLPIQDKSVNLFVTSPPYADSVDYMYNFMLEYFWLSRELRVRNREHFNELRRSFLGAKRPLRERDRSRSTDHRAHAVTVYLEGLGRHLREAYRVLSPSGRYVMVVGNSQTRGGMLPTRDAVVELAKDAGLELETYFGYRIRRHYMKFPRKGRGGIILIDWVLVFRRRAEEGVVKIISPAPWLTLAPDEVAH